MTENEKNRINKTSYKSKYPHNKVTVTPSGHEIHIDDTPGAERIRIAHKSGSYVEYSSDGKKVEYTVGNAQQYNKGGCTVTIDENNDVKVAGHQRVNVSGGSHITVAGDADMVIGGNSTSVVKGNMNAAVNGNMYTGVKGNSKMNVSGSMDMQVAGAMSITAAGDMNLKAANIKLNDPSSNQFQPATPADNSGQQLSVVTS